MRRTIGVIAAICSVLALSAPAAAQVPGEQLWVARDGFTYGYGYWSTADVAVAPDGETVFVTGQYELYEGGEWVYHHLAVMAYGASDGARRWIRFYDGPRGAGFDTNGGFGGPREIAVDPTGETLFVVGFSDHKAWVTGQSPTPNSDYVTLALEADTGARRWVQRYDGPGRGEDVAEALALTPDGGTVIVTGKSQGATGPDAATIAYRASDGARLWLRRVEDPRHNRAIDVAVAPNGNRAVVVGSRTTTEGGRDIAVTAYGVATGKALWTRSYAGSAGRQDDGIGVAISDEPAAYVTGFAREDATGQDIVTLAYDLDGSRRWIARYDGPTDLLCCDRPSAVVARPGGGVVVTGTSTGVGRAKLDFLTLALSPAGGTDWTARWAGSTRSREMAADVAISGDGLEVYVTGRAIEWGTEGDYLTVAYAEAAGAELWWTRYTDPDVTDGADGAQSVAVDPLGRFVVVTGGSAHLVTAHSVHDFTTTIAYST
jgi:hypothetical protein